MGLISGAKRVVLDAWSWLNYKPVFSDDLRGMPNRRVYPEAVATWVPADDERRLAAYKTLVAYDQNQAGELAAIVDGPEARERREFGDAAQFVDTLVSHVLGREQHIVVPGAEDTPTDGDDPDPEAATAARVQELLRAWAEAELLPMRMQQTERKAVLLGDGVYRLAWDPGKRRVTVRSHDPGFYFPVLPEDGDGEFPTRVHFAWELPADPRRKLPARLRRITYELDFIRPASVNGVDARGRAVRAPLPVEAADGDEVPPPILTPGDLMNPDTGAISRMYAWNDEPSYVTCYLTDATWDLGDLKGTNLDVDNLPMDAAVFATRGDGEVLDHLDLMIDFMPIIHVPNTVPGAEEHWGQSSLAKILQVLDELQGTDTDSSKASATTGSPMVSFSGEAAGGQKMLEVGPGIAHYLGANGRMDVLNTAPQLAELRHRTEELRDRAATVARLPAVALGTNDPSQVPSGYALQLSLGPLDALISSMRLARDHKYALLLKMVQRLHIAGQHPDWVGLPVLPARLVFGPYTPVDKTGVLEQVGIGVEKGVLSLETAVAMLTEAGFPIDDAAEEIGRIQARQFEKARALADALGDPQAVADFLGLQPPAVPAPPAPVLPPAPGDQTQDDEDEEDDPAVTSGNTAPGQSGGNPR